MYSMKRGAKRCSLQSFGEQGEGGGKRKNLTPGPGQRQDRMRKKKIILTRRRTPKTKLKYL
jgi:hypothetical protein